jgi:hypothetical protein
MNGLRTFRDVQLATATSPEVELLQTDFGSYSEAKGVGEFTLQVTDGMASK